MALPLALAACQSQVEPAPMGAEVARAAYLGIETRRLDEDLVQFVVTMQGERAREDLNDYADCAAAQYALIRGALFARHVRTTAEIGGARSTGDAVYVVAPGVPEGANTIEAETTVRDCVARGVPTV